MATKTDWNSDRQENSDLLVLRAVVAGVAMMAPEGCSLDDAAQAIAERFHLDAAQAAQARSILKSRAEFDAKCKRLARGEA